MKLKLIVVLSVIAVAFVIADAGCSKSSKESTPASGQTVAYYTCPMHPSVRSDILIITPVIFAWLRERELNRRN
jgi:energy-converting hydrogenase Eha subunit F